MNAPGKPGIDPRWTSSAKSGVGTAASAASRIWFSLSHGIVNEVYYPSLDQANTRDLGFLVTHSDTSFFSEEKRDCVHRIDWIAPGVPGFRLENTCRSGRYRIKKTVLADPRRSALMQWVQFESLVEVADGYRLFTLLAPHIGNMGRSNNGWAGVYKGVPMLFASRDGTCLAFASAPAFRVLSCGYVGVSDGWQELQAHMELRQVYSEASDGNIALAAEVDLKASEDKASVVLAFGTDPEEAALIANECLLQDMEDVLRHYVAGWRDVQGHLLDLSATEPEGLGLYRVSTAVLKVHQEKSIPGAMIASLSIPWGFSKGDNDLGGYHLVWVRDLVEAASGLLAAGDVAAAREALLYLAATQEEDGRWPQNMWLNGSLYWGGVQLDEVAFPILLADALRRMDGLDGLDLWLMVRRAAGFLVQNGPVTDQDRWEEDSGYSPFTLAVVIAGLLAAADFAETRRDDVAASYLRETADSWNASIERWTYVEGTDLARECGVDGYYVRIAPSAGPDGTPAGSLPQKDITIRNRPKPESVVPESHIVSPDALALVRFGLRAANDPRVRNTVKVIDQILRKDTSTGPAWYRYNEDGYGEHDDGRPFDGTGIGRRWPLMTGERAHYELALGKLDEARYLCKVMAAQAGPGGLLPEQIWDQADIPERELFNGRPSGSAMPLVWAHAEYVKLLRSLRDKRIFNLPPQPAKRYQSTVQPAGNALWRFNSKLRRMRPGSKLRVECLAPARIRWTSDDWKHYTDSPTTDTGLGIEFVDLPTEQLPPGATLEFTFFWPEANRWEGGNFQVAIAPSSGDAPG